MFSGVSVDRTIGWFTSLYPFRLDVAGSDIGRQIKMVKGDLRKVPAHGFGYSILKYLSGGRARLDGAGWPKISFNYLGQFDSSMDGPLFTSADGDIGPAICEGLDRQHELDISCEISSYKFNTSILYNTNLYGSREVEALLSAYMEELKEIIHHCSEKGATEKTAVGFTHSGLSEEDYMGVLENLGG